MGRKRPMPRRPPRFTQCEIEEMEKSFLKAGETSDKKFYERLAEKINISSGRSKNRVLHWQQLQSWFQNRQKTLKQGDNKHAFCIVAKKLTTAAKDNIPAKGPESGSKLSEEMGLDVEHIMELEARSSRDNAWYDVSTIISHKYSDSGELKALVRYKDFSSDEDEWVSVKEALRVRSIPIDSTECHIVSVGDHVLCYWEGEDRACHFDALVLSIQRKLHDIRGCRCRFTVQYDHDKSEETVHLDRICRRP